MNVLAIGSHPGLTRALAPGRVQYRLPQFPPAPTPAPAGPGFAPGQEEDHTVEIEVRYGP